MKAKASIASNPSWPAGVPFFDPPTEPPAESVRSVPRSASVGPIELRIGGSDGPAAIAILE